MTQQALSYVEEASQRVTKPLRLFSETTQIWAGAVAAVCVIAGSMYAAGFFHKTESTFDLASRTISGTPQAAGKFVEQKCLELKAWREGKPQSQPPTTFDTVMKVISDIGLAELNGVRATAGFDPIPNPTCVEAAKQSTVVAVQETKSKTVAAFSKAKAEVASAYNVVKDFFGTLLLNQKPEPTP